MLFTTFETIKAAIMGAKVWIMIGCMVSLVALGGVGGYKIANGKYYKLQAQIAQTNADAANRKLAKISKVLNVDATQSDIDTKTLERIKKALDNDAKVTKPNSSCFTKPESDRLRKWPKA